MKKPDIRELMLQIDRDEDKNPLTLEGAIRSVILKHPDSFQYRDDALNVIYCILGAGIDWNSMGRLADNHPNNYMNVPPDNGFGVWSEHGREDSRDDLFSGLPKELAKKLREEMEKKDAQKLQNAIAVVNEIDTRCKIYRPKGTSWYPMSWYACRLCPPENAQLDFIKGAFECAVRFALIEVDFESRWFREQIRNKELAEYLIPVLKERVKYKEKENKIIQNNTK